MLSNVVLGVRLVPNEYQRIKLEDVDLDGKVETLRDIASQKINKAKQELELIYAGVILEDDGVISSYGVKPGVTVHVLERIVEPKPKPAKTLKEADILSLISTVEEFGYRNVLQKLSRPEVQQKILEAAPSLTSDPAVIALLQDPELLGTFADPATLRKVLDVHPVLADALPQIMKYIKENATAMSVTQASTSSGYSYSLEALSDDDDMEGSDAAREGNPLTRNASYNAITAAQLAAAIATATTNFSSTGAVINPAASSANNPIITSEMFGSALQQAFASPTVNRSNSGEESMDGIRSRLSTQLAQMREMGLTNEGLNIRALQATSGDVQAAIELVFNGIIE